ncbi:unnamed protein product, partial [Medioppia subpectinata]
MASIERLVWFDGRSTANTPTARPDAPVGVPTLDSQTVLAVQQLFNDTNASNIANNDVEEEEEDVFQCGKCKKQFSILNTFVNHKKECGRLGSKSGFNRNVHQLSTHDQQSIANLKASVSPLGSHLSLPTSPTISNSVI